MSTKETYATEMRKLILKREIQKISGRLVEEAEELAKETRFYEDDDFKENQIRNVINVAAGGGGVPVVTNFIKYQIGRTTSKDKGWRRNHFGEELIQKLDGLKGDAEKVVNQANQEVKGSQGTDIPEEVREVWIELARLYLGYLNRYFKYRQEKGGGNG